MRVHRVVIGLIAGLIVGSAIGSWASPVALRVVGFIKPIGQLWLNGLALGRIWNIGPQRTLYAPMPFLRQGSNDVIVFDAQGKGSGGTLRGLDKPDLGPMK